MEKRKKISFPNGCQTRTASNQAERCLRQPTRRYHFPAKRFGVIATPLEISSQKTLVSGKAGRQNQILKIEAADDPVSDVKRELSGNPHQKQWGLLRNHHNKGSLKGGISMAEINDGKGIKVMPTERRVEDERKNMLS